jgi:hypothetical protein
MDCRINVGNHEAFGRASCPAFVPGIPIDVARRAAKNEMAGTRPGHDAVRGRVAQTYRTLT